MDRFFHSVTLDKELCLGCTNCCLLYTSKDEICGKGESTLDFLQQFSFLYDGVVALFTGDGWKNLIMFVIGGLLIYLALVKDFEPALLMPMGFGAILVNLPFSGAVNQMNEGLGKEVVGIIDWLFEVGIEASEAMPLLLFIGIGAMIDFGPLLSNPKICLLYTSRCV